jgi:hypothetical protein
MTSPSININARNMTKGWTKVASAYWLSSIIWSGYFDLEKPKRNLKVEEHLLGGGSEFKGRKL